MSTYVAMITHDNLKKDGTVPRGKQKVLVYLVEAEDGIEADKQFQALETQFQGVNFEILRANTLVLQRNQPILIGTRIEAIGG